MTDADVQRLREAKDGVSQRLASERLGDYALERTDPRLLQYVSAVASDPAGHNLFEQLGVERFLRNVRTYGLSRKPIREFAAFFESCPQAHSGGYRCFPLTPVQYFQYASVFGFWVGGSRVVRTALLYVPRKFNKTGGSAVVGANDLLFGDADAEVYTAANSENQAKRAFKPLRHIIGHFDPRGRRFAVNDMEIKSRMDWRACYAQCLTSGSSTKDGLNASTVILDELSQADDYDLKYTLTSSMGVRRNPLVWETTTGSANTEGPFAEELAAAKGVLLGEYEDDSLFAHLFQPDVDDAEDDPAVWRKVHPHMGVTVTESFYAQQWREAQREAAAKVSFRTKLLNIMSEDVRKSWLPSSLARKVMESMDPGSVQGRPSAMVSIDLSERDDFSAVTAGWYDPRDKVFRYMTDYFFPEGALEGHPNESLYRSWAAAGYLTLLPGSVIDYNAIVDHVVGLSRIFRVLRIGYDAYKALDVVNALSAIGGDGVVVAVPQTYGNFTAPCQSFEHGVYTGHVRINANPINAYCWGNAVLDEDKLENCKPVKRTQTAKIDGLVTQLMCHKLFMEFRR